jgi:Uma2 family endonuclease
MSTATLTESAPELRKEHDQPAMETDEALYELVDGKRVEMPPMSIRATMVASGLGSELNAFAKPKRLGAAYVELLVRLPLAEHLNQDRRPDVSFFSYSQLAIDFFQDPEEDALVMIPELAIEVTSPSDRAEDQREKVLEYFRAGVRCVWVVYPRLQLIDVLESPTSLRIFGPDDTLVGDPVLPGFQLRLADLFNPFARPKA